MKLQIHSTPRNSYSEYQLQAVTRHLNLSDIVLPFWGQRRKIPAYRITWLEGQGNYTVVHFSDGSEMIVSLTLKKLEGRLPTEIFVRPHKKSIINLLYLQEIRPGKSTTICLTNGCEIEVSRRKTTHFMRLVVAFQQEFLPLTTQYAVA
ncbi:MULTISPECIES: LytR/AlgR family response regulator transcription factor [Larkinella]|jgi:two-component system LytT family response regulator|uniref:LytR/AlgR family response regulator transcription factor n=1 Tax=Larkinella TaxID=332157 RepID=UPI001CDA2C57|nr:MULTISPECIES: LytTR family DNA-binding domain-containing protein [Larkinella]